jgi:hypothetical protein
MKPRSGLPAKSVIALAGMLAVSAGQANAAEKYANQEVSYAKPASQPSTEQVQACGAGVTKFPFYSLA